MKQHIKCYAAIACYLLTTIISFAQNIPDKPSPFRFVNDYSSVMPASFQSQLEEQLVNLHVSTTSQIAVVTVNSLDGLPASLYATMLGQKWGIGQKGKDNGVIILVKPKTADQKGEAFIATGYGLESSLTDAICTRIVNDGMIPYFKKDDYCGGIHAGVACVVSVINGGSLTDALNHDYSAVAPGSEEEAKDDSVLGIIIQVVKAIFLGLFFLYMPFWVLGLLFNLFWAIVEKDWAKFTSFKSIVGMGCWLFLSTGSAFGGNSSGYRGYGGTYSGGYGGGGYGSGGGSFGGGGGGGSW